jgi:AraC-like DNA-binding protein
MQFHHRELAPVIYGSSGIKFRHTLCGGGDLCFPLHWHDRLELSLVRSGQLNVSFSDTTLTVLPGEVVIVNCGQLHEGFAGPEGVEYDTVMFDVANFRNGTAAAHSLLEPIIDHSVTFLNHCISPEVVAAVEKLIAHCETDIPENALPAVSGVYAILGMLLQNHKAPARTTAVADSRFRAVMEYIDGHFTEDLSCRDLSERFGYDEAYFCRRFKAVTGLTFSRYIRILRLEYAQYLLRKDPCSTHILAQKCGFSDISYFCRCFKAHYRMSPMEFSDTNKS